MLGLFIAIINSILWPIPSDEQSANMVNPWQGCLLPSFFSGNIFLNSASSRQDLLNCRPLNGCSATPPPPPVKLTYSKAASIAPHNIIITLRKLPNKPIGLPSSWKEALLLEGCELGVCKNDTFYSLFKDHFCTVKNLHYLPSYS